MRLEHLLPATRVRGIAGGAVTVRFVEWLDEHGVRLVYEDDDGRLGDVLLYRGDEARIQLERSGGAGRFEADGADFRLATEALRIRLAWLFDPFLALSSSAVEPLPHQISAVYESMLPRQPLRFLLADDPGAGKTIMAGLLVKELLVRGEIARCLVVAPGSLVEQWQDELGEKFDLRFQILTRELLDGSSGADPLAEDGLWIARLDQLSRDDDLLARLQAAPEWDLVVCDEAHRMSAHHLGTEIKYTRRHQLGRTLGERTRHFLLMTATPHNGHEADFQLFMALLDPDRFEGRATERRVDAADLMRRLVKERLYTFEGRPLFPPRCSYTVRYRLSADEAALYRSVTAYVRDEMNRADRLAREGEEQRRVNVGFALMTLQRRLASSPEAITRSIERRRERLETRLEALRRGREALAARRTDAREDWDDLELDLTDDEREGIEAHLVDHATASRSLAELEAEIATLRSLEGTARAVRRSEADAKWSELTRILDLPEMRRADGSRRKLVVFTEFRDTLTYLAQRIRTRLGRPDAVVEIHGGVSRDDRRRAVHAFMEHPDVVVLVANDAAGEGVNLQRAHLMVNYDLPWNPNRLEQRFGRIHRIGQREVCHLWNLVAAETREGEVYGKLLEKLAHEAAALSGQVYDVLGQLFEGTPLRDLLVDAIRHGDSPEVRARIEARIEGVVDRAHVEEILARNALADDTMDVTRVRELRAEMDRARAQRLQPHFVAACFRAALERLGGRAREREPGRLEITHVPREIRDRARKTRPRAPVVDRYERVTFERDLIPGPPQAMLVYPGQVLLDSTLDEIHSQLASRLRDGAILVAEREEGTTPRVVFLVDHEIQDGRSTRSGLQVVSRRLAFVEARPDGGFADAGFAPHLDCRPASDAERAALARLVASEWVARASERDALRHALVEIVPRHVEAVRARVLPRVDRVEREVRGRLTREITHWDNEAVRLRDEERAGRRTRLPWQQAEERANRLQERLRLRLARLDEERRISPRPPRIVGWFLMVPPRALATATGAPPGTEETEDKRVVERLAVEAVMAAERAIGRDPVDVGDRKLGHDVESTDRRTGAVFFIEVKGRDRAADTIVLTKNEVLRALNVPDQFRLAIVLVEEGVARPPVYVTDFDWGHPGFAQTHSTYRLDALLARSGPPR